MKISRPQWIAGIAIAVMILLTIIVPPSRSQITEGSTYSRSPSGYAGWYAYMQTNQIKSKVKILRWQKSFQTLDADIDAPITLLRINSQLESVSKSEREWLDRGNNLILIGVNAKATEAPFSKLISNKSGRIKIETTRRQGASILAVPNEKLALKLALNTPVDSDSSESDEDIKLLGDEFGSIVWKNSEGNLISSATTYLAANAYQNEEGNYKFLANLVTAFKTPIYIDEYIHGYRDKDADEATTEQDWISYLTKTPLFAGAVQALVVLVVLIIAKNRRFGAAIANPSPLVNNSQAYIQAMSTVLQKAQTHEFVWQAIAKAEQKKLAQKLGVKDSDRQALISAWQQTGRSESELENLFNPVREKIGVKISDRQLLNWLLNWQKVLKSLS